VYFFSLSLDTGELCVIGTSYTYVSMGSLLYDTLTAALLMLHTLSHSPARSHAAYRRMYESGTIPMWISYST